MIGKGLLAAALAGIAIAGCGGGGFNDNGGSLRGFLSSGDWIVGNGFYADRYIMRSTRTGDVSIDMSSNELDAYLVVIDEFGNSIEDDDSGPGSDAQLTFWAESGREYEVRATSFDAQDTGRYELFWSPGLRFSEELRGRGKEGALKDTATRPPKKQGN